MDTWLPTTSVLFNAKTCPEMGKFAHIDPVRQPKDGVTLQPCSLETLLAILAKRHEQARLTYAAMRASRSAWLERKISSSLSLMSGCCWICSMPDAKISP